MSNDVRSSVAAEVRAALARHQKTQRELAAELHLVQPSVQLRLAGARSFRAEEIAVISAWLGEPLDRLIPVPARPVAA